MLRTSEIWNTEIKPWDNLHNLLYESRNRKIRVTRQYALIPGSTQHAAITALGQIVKPQDKPIIESALQKATTVWSYS